MAMVLEAICWTHWATVWGTVGSQMFVLSVSSSFSRKVKASTMSWRETGGAETKTALHQLVPEDLFRHEELARDEFDGVDKEAA